MNNAVLIGRLTKDPELGYTPNNNEPVCKFTLAVDRPKRNGEDMGADFIRIVVWGKTAENCDKYLSKGRQVGIQGRIQTGSYENKQGQKIYTTDVIANNVEFLGGADAPKQEEPQDEPQEYDNFQQAEDDIPF